RSRLTRRRLWIGVADLCEPYLGHPAFLNQFGDASLVQLRPVLMIRPRGKLSRVASLVDALDDAVNPAVAQRLFHRLFVGHAARAGLLLRKYDPHFSFRGV